MVTSKFKVKSAGIRHRETVTFRSSFRIGTLWHERPVLGLKHAVEK